MRSIKKNIKFECETMAFAGVGAGWKADMSKGSQNETKASVEARAHQRTRESLLRTYIGLNIAIKSLN